MKKMLLLYWYVPSFEWCPLYDLHIRLLNVYKDRFDKVTVVLSTDCEGLPSEIRTAEKLLSIFPDAEIEHYPNDSVLRESRYFYNRVVKRLDDFPDDEVIFFAHNKGVASYYVGEEELKWWISFMYYANLENLDFLSEFELNKSLCCAGTYMTDDYKYWSFLKYNWHYSGTFFWFIPNRVYKMILDNKEEIPNNCRYFTEGFFGSVIPNEDKYRKALFGVRSSKEKYDAFVRRVLKREERKKVEKFFR